MDETQNERLVSLVLFEIDPVWTEFLDVDSLFGFLHGWTPVSTDERKVRTERLHLVLLYQRLRCTHHLIHGHVDLDGVYHLPQSFANHLVVHEHQELRKRHEVVVSIEARGLQIPAVEQQQCGRERREVE